MVLTIHLKLCFKNYLQKFNDICRNIAICQKSLQQTKYFINIFNNDEMLKSIFTQTFTKI